MSLRRYRRRDNTPVTGVRLDLDTEGFRYRKWGGEQLAKPGDWLIKNGADTYTVDAATFAATYEEVSPGRFVKVKPVWAEVATDSGSLDTLEGSSDYEAGDFLVFPGPERRQGWVIKPDDFDRLYEPQSQTERSTA